LTELEASWQKWPNLISPQDQQKKDIEEIGQKDYMKHLSAYKYGNHCKIMKLCKLKSSCGERKRGLENESGQVLSGSVPELPVDNHFQKCP
jgi:hypothetical protein